MAEKVLVASIKDPSRTKLVRPGEARVLVDLGRWQYATGALEAGPPARRARDPLDGIAFASEAAATAAREAEPPLAARDFSGQTGSGQGGAFTKADVLAIAASRKP